jgi:hypothetical protein
MSDNKFEAVKRVRHLATFMAASTPDSVHEALGTPLKRVESIREALTKGLVDEAMDFMSDKMINDFSVAGKANECLEKVEAFFNSGVTQMIFVVPGGTRDIASACSAIISSLKT